MNHWGKVWHRFTEAPANWPGIAEWLKRATPKNPGLFDSAEVWPNLNEGEERKLQEALASLVDRPQDEAIRRVAELEARHAERRSYPWQRLGLSPLATALGPLAQLAGLCRSAPGASTPEAYAAAYAGDGWRVDAAALATMAACGSPEQHGAVLGTLRAIYLPWLENTARHLQQLIHANGRSVSRRAKPIAAAAGRLVVFADGLRMDVAQQLAEKLAAAGIASTQDWEWSAIPSVTATAKPAASPVADAVQGGDANDEFAARLVGQLLTQERFVTALKDRGWQVLGSDETGDPAGSAWTGAKCRLLVGGDCSGVQVDIRTSQSDANTSLLTDKQARETTADGRVTVFLEDDADIGRQAEIVLLDTSGQVIDALPTTLGQ